MNQDQIPIWDDPDVRAIFDFSSFQPRINLSLLAGADEALMIGFVNADARAQDQSPASDFVGACIAGVAAFERLSSQAPIGFRKFLVHQVALNASMMWDRFSNANETRIFSDWAMATLSANLWNPDGGATPLGQRATWNMGVAAQSGGGIRTNPSTGRWEGPDGEEARVAASKGFVEYKSSPAPSFTSQTATAPGQGSPPGGGRRRWIGRH